MNMKRRYHPGWLHADDDDDDISLRLNYVTYVVALHALYLNIVGDYTCIEGQHHNTRCYRCIDICKTNDKAHRISGTMKGFSQIGSVKCVPRYRLLPVHVIQPQWVALFAASKCLFLALFTASFIWYNSCISK